MFLCCHPALGTDAQVALDAAAARRARDRGDRTGVPRAARRRWRSGSCGPSASCATTTPPTASHRAAELPDRLHAVLDRDLPDLHRGPHRDRRATRSCARTSRGEAIRLGRVLVDLDARRARGGRAARADAAHRGPPAGAHRRRRRRWCAWPTRTATRWDRALIDEGHDARARLPAPQPAGTVPDPGRHRRRPRRRAERGRRPTGRRSSTLYDQLYALRPDPVVALNRADRARRARRSRRRSRRRATASTRPQVDGYQPFHAARADLLGRAGRADEAVAAYDRAIELTTNPTELRFLRDQRRRVVRP